MLPRALRIASFGLLAAAALAAACGHLPFDELPAADEALVSDGGSTGTRPDGNIVIFDEGGVGIEAGPPPDAGLVDVVIIDPPIDGGIGSDAGADAGCADCIIYVSAKASTNNGTATGGPDDPVATISEALKLAAQSFGKRSEIRVAGGQKYAGSITLVEGVQIFGGYSCDKTPCAWDRNVDLWPTTVYASANTVDLDGVLVADHTITRNTVVDGMTFQGGDGSPATVADGVITARLLGGPVLRNVTIVGGTSRGTAGPGARSIAVFIAGQASKSQGVLITGSSITGGKSNVLSAAVFVQRADLSIDKDADVRIEETSIHGGGGNGTVIAVVLAGAGGPTRFLRDSIEPAPAGTSGTATESWAVRSVGGVALIDASLVGREPAALANSMFCASTTMCGGVDFVSGSLEISNSVIRGVPARRSTALRIDVNADSVAKAGNNTLNIVNDVLRGEGANAAGTAQGGSMSAGITLRNLTGIPVTEGTFKNSIILGGTNLTNYAFFSPDDSTGPLTPFSVDHDAFEDISSNLIASLKVSGQRSDTTFDNRGKLGWVDAITTYLTDCGIDPLTSRISTPKCKDLGTGTSPDHDVDGAPRPGTLANPLDLGINELP